MNKEQMCVLGQKLALNKILNDKGSYLYIVESLHDEGITRDHFEDYLNEYDFIINHIKNYGARPSKYVFSQFFPNFPMLNEDAHIDFIIDLLNGNFNIEKVNLEDVAYRPSQSKYGF